MSLACSKLFSQYRSRDIPKRMFLLPFHNLFVHVHVQKMKFERNCSPGNRTWSVLGKRNVQVKEVYSLARKACQFLVFFFSYLRSVGGHLACLNVLLSFGSPIATG